MQDVPSIIALVGGSDEEKEEQESEIREYCSKRLGVLSSDIEVLDRDRILQEKLKEWKGQRGEDAKAEDAKGRCVVVVTDLRVISRDTGILARNLYEVLIDRGIRIEVVNEEHRDSLRCYQPGHLTGERLESMKPRLRAGLEELAREILEPK
jgi:hypothetical protein